MRSLAQVMQNPQSRLRLDIEQLFRQIVAQQRSSEARHQSSRGPKTGLVRLGERDIEVEEVRGGAQGLAWVGVVGLVREDVDVGGGDCGLGLEGGDVG